MRYYSMLKVYISIFILFQIYTTPVLEHDIHISVVKLIQEKETDSMEMIVQVFLDDLMNSVGLTPGEPLPDDYTSADDLLQKFVEDHLNISINDSIVTPVYKENVASTPAVWITYEIKNPPLPIQSIDIENDIMLDLFDDQLNLIHIEFPDHTSAHTLDAKKTKKKIVFKKE